ncbi:hypothetical protein [Streptomyces sp. NPDC057403]|uniref:hypothetical protein n=1 Tax=Streptomyces sp. NPDC057403 TaxID=3346119 RepID=UPI0036CD52CF
MAWQWLVPVAQRREEEPAGVRAYVGPHGVGGQGVVPETGAPGGVDLGEAAAEGLEMALILWFEVSALRELARREEGREVQGSHAQVRVAEVVHPGRIAPQPP